jgi:hypothetical protein
MHAGVVLVTNTEIYPNFCSERCIFSNNSARSGIGGVYHGCFRLTIAHIILDSSFQKFNNTALHCGVLFAATFSTGYVNNITIESSLFTYNNAIGSSGEGGVACIGYSSVFVKCSAFSHNTAAQNGGVIHINQSDINIESSSFIYKQCRSERWRSDSRKSCIPENLKN